MRSSFSDNCDLARPRSCLSIWRTELISTKHRPQGGKRSQNGPSCPGPRQDTMSFSQFPRETWDSPGRVDKKRPKPSAGRPCSEPRRARLAFFRAHLVSASFPFSLPVMAGSSPAGSCPLPGSPLPLENRFAPRAHAQQCLDEPRIPAKTPRAPCRRRSRSRGFRAAPPRPGGALALAASRSRATTSSGTTQRPAPAKG